MLSQLNQISAQALDVVGQSCTLSLIWLAPNAISLRIEKDSMNIYKIRHGLLHLKIMNTLTPRKTCTRSVTTAKAVKADMKMRYLGQMIPWSSPK